MSSSHNITLQRSLLSFSQHALRLIAFRKLHLVLGVDPLPGYDQSEAQFETSISDETENGTFQDGGGTKSETQVAMEEISVRGEEPKIGMKRDSQGEDGVSPKKLKLDETK